MSKVWWIVVLTAACLIITICHARDSGQWEGQDAGVSAWYRSLTQPDYPTASCCGEADAYWADSIEVKDGKTYAIITDPRPDEQFRRPHIPLGTRFEVPPNKLKWDRGNPTGHAIIFVTPMRDVLCYVQNGGV